MDEDEMIKAIGGRLPTGITLREVFIESLQKEFDEETINKILKRFDYTFTWNRDEKTECYILSDEEIR